MRYRRAKNKALLKKILMKMIACYSGQTMKMRLIDKQTFLMLQKRDWIPNLRFFGSVLHMPKVISKKMMINLIAYYSDQMMKKKSIGGQCSFQLMISQQKKENNIRETTMSQHMMTRMSCEVRMMFPFFLKCCSKMKCFLHYFARFWGFPFGLEGLCWKEDWFGILGTGFLSIIKFYLI